MITSQGRDVIASKAGTYDSIQGVDLIVSKV